MVAHQKQNFDRGATKGVTTGNHEGHTDCWVFFSSIEAPVVVNWCYINESGFAITAPANAK